jgi:hypothetical protein
MTLQEKTAKDLVWKFYHQIEHAISDEYAKEDWEIAKQCAIIAINEIILFGDRIANSGLFGVPSDITFTFFSKEVKQEIKKL